MAKTLQTELNLLIQPVYKSGEGAMVQTVNAPFRLNTIWESGGSANQAQVLFYDRRTLGTTSESLDIFDLSGARDGHGDVLAFAGIKMLIIRYYGAGTLKVGGNGTTAAWNSPFGGDDDALLQIEAGGFLILAAPTAGGYPVADTANHLLKIENTGTSADYEIWLIGE